MLPNGFLDLPLILESEPICSRVMFVAYGVIGAVEIRLEEV